MKSNFERMIQLADDIFASRTVSDQLSVDEKVMTRLEEIHPASLSEHNDGNGPVAWVLVFPTTTELMNEFLAKRITEKKLFDLTPLGISYDAIYLCSALVLEEYRNKGIAKKLTREAVKKINQDHPIKTLFVWPFTPAGDVVSSKIAEEIGIPLKKYGMLRGH
jgi:ribosomal protein S18 acetylase RimI-like enzyme